MNRLVLFLLCILPLGAFAQDARYYYTFSVDGVKTVQEAKPVSEALFHMFDVMPHFNKSIKKFQFASPVNLDENRLTIKVKSYGYNIKDFKKSFEPPAKE